MYTIVQLIGGLTKRSQYLCNF